VTTDPAGAADASILAQTFTAAGCAGIVGDRRHGFVSS
jgi:hypothetical protein